MAECGACGLVCMDPLPERSFLKEKVYSREAGYQVDKLHDLSSVRPEPWWFRLISEVADLVPGKRLLDVGCSSGQFMYFAKERGYDTKGVELNSLTANIALANGLSVHIGTLEDAPYSDNSFDVVFLGDVIEHVTDPRDFVRACARVLTDTGVLAISTPNLDCFWSRSTFLLYRFLGIPWSSVTPPHHTFQFSKRNLSRLLAEEGFTVTSVWFRPPPSLFYELASTHLRSAWKRKRSFVTLARLLVGGPSYVFLYGLNRVIAPLARKDFSMVVIACRA